MKKEKIAEFKEAYKGMYKQAMEKGDFNAAVNAVDSLVRLEAEHDPGGVCDKVDATGLTEEP